MEPIIHIVDYPSFPILNNSELMKKEWKEVIDKLVNMNIRHSLGGNKGIHRPNDV